MEFFQLINSQKGDYVMSTDKRRKENEDSRTKPSKTKTDVSRLKGEEVEREVDLPKRNSPRKTPINPEGNKSKKAS